MATVLNTSEQRVLLRGVSWETYSRLAAERQESSGTRLCYDLGTLEILSPSFKHENLKETITRVFQLIADEMTITFQGVGSTTFRREDLGKGFEPDACFYIRHAQDVRGKEEIDLNIDPPPDLVIEIDIAKSSLNKLALYAAAGVPEVWRYSGSLLKILHLKGQGYVEEAQSLSLPHITSTTLTDLVESSHETDRDVWIRLVRASAKKI